MKKYTDKEIIDKYKKLRKELGRHPSGDEFYNKYKIMQITIRQRFGSYKELERIAGYKSKYKRIYMHICKNCGKIVEDHRYIKGDFFCSPECEKQYNAKHKTYIDYLKEASKRDPLHYKKVQEKIRRFEYLKKNSQYIPTQSI